VSAPHHGSQSEHEARSRLLDQFLGKAAPAYPGGRLNSSDDGELAFAIALDPSKRIVILRFGKAVDWVGLAKPEAIHLANMILEKANQL
jgi:hypothetical protein